MTAKEVHQEILEYLKKEGPLNTFRLATSLNVDRYKLLNVIKKLEKAGAVKVQHGLVRFLKFAVKEQKAEKPIGIKKTVFKPKRKVIKKRKKFKKTSITPRVQAENKELKEKILQLESKIEVLEKKASAPPQIIKKTIVKKILVPSAPVPIPRSPSSLKKRVRREKIKKFKIPKFEFLKSIKQLKKPEFTKK